MHRVRVRSAIAMIELIFAIVVMGIALMSAPMLIATASKSTTVALQQEGINEAASRVSMILTYPWDQNDTNDSCIPPVLHVVNGDNELNESTANRRIGVPVGSNSRTFKWCNGTELNASPIGKEGNEIDDQDDFDGTTVHLTADATGSGGTDYIEQTTIDINTTVSYIGDSANYASKSFSYTPQSGSGSSTNIKEIQVTLTSSSSETELQKNITLKAFSCNIGGIEYAHREF